MKVEILTCLFLIVCVVSSRHLIDVTDISLGASLRGKAVAYGDFNADKNTDIFLITESGKNVNLLLTSREKGTLYSLYTLLTVKDDGVVTNVVPADFDGDAQMDVFITVQKSGAATRNVRGEIHWGSSNSVRLEPVEKALIFPDEFADQPIIFDYNGDMIPDLMGEKLATKERMYWVFNKGHRNVSEVKVTSTNSSLHQPQTSGFVDLNNDLTADLCAVSTKSDGKPQVEFWLNTGGEMVLDTTKTLPYPDGKAFGQLTFLDMGITDGRMDILLPACLDDNCSAPVVYLLQSSKWIKLPISFSGQGLSWGFVPPDEKNTEVGYIPISLRAGDFNLDGYPDLFGVLRNVSSTGITVQRAFLFENIHCSGSQCGGSTRTFKIDFETSLHPSGENAILPAFFDYMEDGILDVLVTTQTKDKKLRVHMMKQDFTDDACFVKVMVVSGLCFENCPIHREPYGVNQWGPVVRYSTLNTEGNTQTAIASQLTQSAYCPLQLPFTVFGLGQTPNFVENLEVGIPNPKGTEPRHKTWTSIIPNAQLIVIPYPNDKPDSWFNKLFVTPSRLVLLTGATLLGTCGFIAGIVGILHWREKVEDKREKLQEAHKFHFDAM